MSNPLIIILFTLKLEINVHSIVDAIMASKLKIKGPQISALSKEFIKVSPGAKGSLHDGILKLRNELASVVIKVS